LISCRGGSSHSPSIPTGLGRTVTFFFAVGLGDDRKHDLNVGCRVASVTEAAKEATITAGTILAGIVLEDCMAGASNAVSCVYISADTVTTATLIIDYFCLRVFVYLSV